MRQGPREPSETPPDATCHWCKWAGISGHNGTAIDTTPHLITTTQPF